MPPIDAGQNNHDRITSPRTIFVALPAYNEEIAIGRLLEKIHTLSNSTDYHVKVVVYNDGCVDATPDIALSWKDRLDIVVLGEATNRGLGVGLRSLVEYSAINGDDEDLFVLMDCDDTHNPNQIPQMIEEIDAGNDVVIASRFQRGASIRGVPRHRQILTAGAVLLFKSIYPIEGVSDYTCGYRCYRVRLLKQAWAEFGPALVRNAGFSCMVELLLKLNLYMPRFKEIPLALRYDLKPTQSKMAVGNNVRRLLQLLLIWKVRGIRNC
jgi:dolichol-phosphate mannosyltransferase